MKQYLEVIIYMNYNENDKNYNENSIVYSGVSMGLPGSYKNAFEDNNFKRVINGENMIEKLTEDECRSILELNITRIIKNEMGAAFKKVESINEVIQLAGKFGRLDMDRDYLLDDKKIKNMSASSAASIAAGYEALRDAGIPLLMEYTVTASGDKLPSRLALPKSMQEGTAVIMAGNFSFFEPVINEISKFVAYKYSCNNLNELISFYEAVLTRLSDSDSRKILTDWFVENYTNLNNEPDENDVFNFNHNFMNLLSSLANSRFAQLIGAKGPNLQVGAACGSTACGIAIAESFIKTEQAERAIIIGAEMPSNNTFLPWIGAGLTSIGAATISPDISSAALPFDNRRNGMIIGSGAIGIVMEKENDIEKRGMNGICRLLGAHAFNTSGHQTHVDGKTFSLEMDRFLSKMERKYGLNRMDIASRTMYLSHETYASKEGGCSLAEKVSLEYCFKEKFSEVLICNSKGFTGNTMGIAIEEALAAKSLQYQLVPPIANYKESDAALEGLKLSKGGPYTFEYCLRTAVGFGGQGSFSILEKIAVGEKRIIDSQKYEAWTRKETGLVDFNLVLKGRIFTAEENKVQGAEPGKALPELYEKIKNDVLEIFSIYTQYPLEMIDPAMEIYEDLGIDTQQPEKLLDMIAAKFGQPEVKDIYLPKYHRVDMLIDYLVENNDKFETKDRTKTNVISVKDNKEMDDDIKSTVLEVFSRVTEYPVEVLDPAMEIYFDLGVDTIKLAIIKSELEKKYGCYDNLSHRNISTINDIIEEVYRNQH
jgi:3-oxoacyl-(acyl-carrier-protein) synthase/acyl carrier protein